MPFGLYLSAVRKEVVTRSSLSRSRQAASAHHYEVHLLLLRAGLPTMNWICFFVWLAISLMIYFSFSRKRRTLRRFRQRKNSTFCHSEARRVPRNLSFLGFRAQRDSSLRSE
jgi:hypothetical protein